ncbi:MAG TPA: NRDE family protein, partial [Gammaproteobacteria bacterium]
LLALLADPAPHGADSAAPEHPWREALSAIFVRAPGYGTRCSTLLLVDRAGAAHFVERRFDADGSLAGSSRERWRLAPGGPGPA